MYEEPAKLSTTRATSKNSRNLKNKCESNNKNSFKRIPAKRVARRNIEYLTGNCYLLISIEIHLKNNVCLQF